MENKETSMYSVRSYQVPRSIQFRKADESVVTVTVTGLYRTSLPIHCDHYLSTVFLILSSELSGSNQQRHLVAKQEKI
jgi:hypothetical protein